MILQGDNMQIMPQLEAERFNCCVTSPPLLGIAGLRHTADRLAGDNIYSYARSAAGDRTGLDRLPGAGAHAGNVYCSHSADFPRSVEAAPE